MSTLRPVDGEGLRYARLIATGGIGHGILFLLEGDQTLGRNESRPGTLQKARDYCKLHITCHYAARLLRPAGGSGFEVIPIGRLGDDAAGAALAEEMRSAGMCMDEVAVLEGRDTLFSVCFQYPDRSGGNVTTAGSASSLLTAADVEAACGRHPTGPGPELFLSVPEAPLDARIRLLRLGRERGAFTAASFLATEAEDFARRGGFSCTDLLVVNIDEARAMARIGEASLTADETADACAEASARYAPSMRVVVTNGADGSYAFHEGRLRRCPGVKVQAVSTGGAGDAFMAGVLAGLCCGLPFMREGERGADAGGADAPRSMECAVDLGTAVAAMSVTSPDSIHAGIDADTLRRFTIDKGLSLSPPFHRLFAGAGL